MALDTNLFLVLINECNFLLGLCVLVEEGERHLRGSGGGGGQQQRQAADHQRDHRAVHLLREEQRGGGTALHHGH